jgi:hypothetical protein
MAQRGVRRLDKHVIVETQEGHEFPGRILSWAVAKPDRRP